MKKPGLIVSLLVSLILLASVLSAQAAPSLQGYTGLVLIPNADTLDEKDYNVGFFTLNLEEGADEDIWTGNLGVDEGMELGVTRFKPEDGESETLLNAKYRIRTEEDQKPGLAVGIFDATDELDTTVYLVMSKTVPDLITSGDKEIFAPRIHVGVGGGQLSGFFGGLSFGLGDNLMLMAEYLSLIHI